MEGGGFVTVSADDADLPVMGFSPSGELPDGDARNPFWSLVGADALDRKHHPAGKKFSGKRFRRHNIKAHRFSFADTTSSLSQNVDLSATSTSTSQITSETELDDVRVAPLIKSKWNQSYVSGKKTYNYYTPNGWPCGCVATALAQLMRFHCFPSNTVAAHTFTCESNNIAIPLTMKGGTYDWGNMPLVPSSSITDAQREAIGRICYDAGVAVRMWYGSSGSSAIQCFAFDPLKNVFGYANACAYVILDDEMSLSELDMKNSILANLDAGYPVLLGICHMDTNYDASDGHAIIADGYGYLDDTLYCHLNMGWSGSYDYWYALPDIGPNGSSHRFNSVLQLVYNVFPDRTGELVTGRIANRKGVPRAGATVNATFTYTKNRRQYTDTATTMTDANGIYAFFTPADVRCTVTLSAEYGGWSSTNVTFVKKACVSLSTVDFDTGDYWPGSGLTIGNSWGNDFTYDPPPPFKVTIR